MDGEPPFTSRPFDWAEEPPSFLYDSGIYHQDGIPWWKAPKPPWVHRCWAWTSGSLDRGVLVERCPCGAIRLDGEGWLERNSENGERPPWWRLLGQVLFIGP